MIELQKEEIFIFIDITTNFLKKKIILRGIKELIEKKKQINILTIFNLLLFKEDASPLLIMDKTSYREIIDILSENWNYRNKTSLFENGMFLTLSEILKKAKKGVANYRIIVITDSPSEIPEEMTTTLFDLISKVKILPTFIDIVRVGDKKFYADDVKLKIITIETTGGMFYANSTNYFMNIMNVLAKNKQIPNVFVGEIKKQIQPEDKLFYEKLASDLLSPEPGEELTCTICNMPICPICLNKHDTPHKCFNCNTAYHECCAAQYSGLKNIGLIHIFRCAGCGTLLKLEESIVMEKIKNLEQLKLIEEDIETLEEKRGEAVKTPIPSSSEEFISISSETEISDDNKADLIIINGDKSKTFEDLVPSPPPPPTIKKKIRPGGFFGPEIEIEEKQQQPQKEIKPQKYWSPTGSTPSQISSITQLKPPKTKPTLRFCKICGGPIKGNDKACRSCGAPV